MAVLALGVATMAFVPGYRRHRQLWIPVLGLLGVSALLYSAFVDPACCAEAATATARTSASSDAPDAGSPSGCCADCDAAPEPVALPAATDCCGADSGCAGETACESGDCPLPADACKTGCGACTASISRTSVASDLRHSRGGLNTLLGGWLTMIGGLLLVLAHVLNLSLSPCRRACCAA